MASRQLRCLGKIAQIDKTRLPRKFIGAWHTNPRPVGCPQQTIWHTYLHALCIMGAIPKEDKEGKFETWFPQAIEDLKEWVRCRKLFTPNLIGQQVSADN
eukprot:9695894-Ditylum_brightwellii.AAC.1